MTRTNILLRDYTFAAVASWLAAEMMASVADWAQHNLWPEPYLLLPTNLVSFYFLPLFAGAVHSLALRREHVHWSVTIAMILALLFTAARVLFWWSVTRVVILNRLDPLEAALKAEESLTSAVVSALGLCAYIALVVAIQRTFKEEPPTTKADPSAECAT